MSNIIKVDHAGMGFGAVAHEGCIGQAQIDGKAKAFVDHRRAIDQRCARVQRGQGGIIERCVALTETELV